MVNNTLHFAYDLLLHGIDVVIMSFAVSKLGFLPLTCLNARVKGCLNNLVRFNFAA